MNKPTNVNYNKKSKPNKFITQYKFTAKDIIQCDITETINNLKHLFLKLNNGKLNKEQKRCLTSLYNQLIKSMKEL